MVSTFACDILKFRNGCDFSPKPSFVRITTITAITSISKGTIDIEKVRERFSRGFKLKPFSVDGFDRNYSSDVIHWKLKDNGFYNQATIEYQDAYSKKSVKIFPNSTVHITGCYCIEDCSRVTKQLCFMFGKIFEPVECDPCRIVMINTNFSINSHLDLSKIISVMKAKGCIVTFNPETYSAVKIKLTPGEGMKQVTASVFSSGKVIITGAVTMTEISCTYKFLLNCIKENKDICLRGVDNVDVFDNFLGRSFSSSDENSWQLNIG
jgi:TATA-box binding protein (TBP) (component of TFIID and TFIIIB)